MANLNLMGSICLVVSLATSAHAEQFTRRTIQVEGLERTYYRHKSNQPQSSPLPVVVTLHGGGGTAEGLRRSYGFLPMVDAGEMIAVYPDAIRGAWNVGGLPLLGGRPAPTQDDVAFLDAVIDEVLITENVDPSRIFVTGASRGGLMTTHFIARTQHDIRGAGTVISSVVQSTAENFQLPHPVDFAIMAGTEDPLMPYNGSEQGPQQWRTLPIEDFAELMVQANGIAAQPQETSLGNANRWDNCTNELRFWEDPDSGARVARVKVIGGSHVVPGRWQCRDFDHAQAMWSFFKQAWDEP